MKRIGTVAVMTQGHLLIGKRSDTSRWCMPGGHIEDGESPVEGARRELEEETGIVVSVDDLKLISAKVVTGYSGKLLQIYSYLLDGAGKEVTRTEGVDPGEAHDWAWVNVTNGLPPDIHAAWNNYSDPTLEALGLRVPVGHISSDIADDGTNTMLEKTWPKHYKRVKGQHSDEGAASKKQLGFMRAAAAGKVPGVSSSVGKDYVRESKGDAPESGKGRQSEKHKKSDTSDSMYAKVHGHQGHHMVVDVKDTGKPAGTPGGGNMYHLKHSETGKTFTAHQSEVHDIRFGDELEKAEKPYKGFKEGKNHREGGLSVAEAKRQGIRAGVETKREAESKGGWGKLSDKTQSRRKSFCARMCGMKSRNTSAETARDPKSKINASLRVWGCRCNKTESSSLGFDWVLDFVVDEELMAKSDLTNADLVDFFETFEETLVEKNAESALDHLYDAADAFFDWNMSPEEQAVYELSDLAKSGDQEAVEQLKELSKMLVDDLSSSGDIASMAKAAVLKSNYGPKGWGMYSQADNAGRKARNTGEAYQDAGKIVNAKQYTPSARGTMSEQAGRIAAEDSKRNKKQPVKVASPAEVAAMNAKMREGAAKSEDNSGGVTGKHNGESVRLKHGYKCYTSGPNRGKYVHRVEAEKKLGRKLKSSEHVDHKSGNRQSSDTKVMSASAHAAKTNKTRAGKGFSGSKRYAHTRDS